VKKNVPPGKPPGMPIPGGGGPMPGGGIGPFGGKGGTAPGGPIPGGGIIPGGGNGGLAFAAETHIRNCRLQTDHFDLRGPNGGGPPNPIGGTPKGGGGPVRCCGPKPNPPAGGPPVDS